MKGKKQRNWSYRKLLKTVKGKKKTAKLELQKIIDDYEEEKNPAKLELQKIIEGCEEEEEEKKKSETGKGIQSEFAATGCLVIGPQ